MDDNPYSAPEADDASAVDPSVTVEISAKWVDRINSPMFSVVSALTGVSITFVPLAMLGLGIMNNWNVLTIGAAVVTVLIGFFVPLFYFLVAGVVIRQVHRKSPDSKL